MKRIPRSIAIAAFTAAALELYSCSDATDPLETDAIEFSTASLELGAERDATIGVRNVGTSPMGPIQLSAGAVRAEDGALLPDARITITPSEIPTLNPGTSRSISIAVEIPSCTGGGHFWTCSPSPLCRDRLRFGKVTS